MGKQYLSIRIEEGLLSRIDQLAKRTRRTKSQVGEMLLEQSLKEDKMEPIFRQGDLLLRKIDKLPDGKRKKRPTGHVLEGEATGHVHRILELEQAEVLKIGEGLFVSVGEHGVSLIHPEHHTIELPAGDFEITRQREYFPDEIRNVQ